MRALRTRALLACLLGFTAFSARADVVAYFANGEEARPIEFGDGSDGAFADGPAQLGISVVGATITVDTSVKHVFQFTSFTLTAGHTLVATGGSPLVVRVQGAATIAGTIDLNGAAGGNATAGGPGAGGVAGAGGGSGGAGGQKPPTAIESAAGTPSSGNSRGGGNGPNSAGFGNQLGGGGGCNGPGATGSTNGGTGYPASAASCPSTRDVIAGLFETAYSSTSTSARAGGGGGGGGGTQANAANAMNGAGGGGAGGAIRLSSAGELAVSGTIRANGGAGGDGDSAGGGTDYGSSGGGGSGGSLWLQSASRISGAGTLAVSSGAGGQDAFAVSIGGDGSRGVIRLDAVSNAFTGSFTPAGAADLVYPVYPLTVEFALHAGPACGVVEAAAPPSPDRSVRDVAGLTLTWAAAFLLARRRSSRPKRRSN